MKKNSIRWITCMSFCLSLTSTQVSYGENLQKEEAIDHQLQPLKNRYNDLILQEEEESVKADELWIFDEKKAKEHQQRAEEIKKEEDRLRTQIEQLMKQKTELINEQLKQLDEEEDRLLSEDHELRQQEHPDREALKKIREQLKKIRLEQKLLLQEEGDPDDEASSPYQP